jgi:hypothetical protein
MELLGMSPLVVRDFTPELKLLLTVLFRDTPSDSINQQLLHLLDTILGSFHSSLRILYR